jgi:putative membrane protein
MGHPGILAWIVLVGWLYARGVGALWGRAGVGRGVERWRAAAFGAGLLALAVALASPLDALGGVLFSAHMAQHMLLAVVAAPLLVLGAGGTGLLWALGEAGRRRVGGWWRGAGRARAVWRGVSHPLSAWALHVGVLWAWHLPGLYQAALGDALVHAAEHASFLGSGWLFWWTVLGTGHGRLNAGAGVLYLFTASLAGGVLGVLMTFAPAAWYPAYAASAPVWGLSGLEDQQVAGLIMWIPAGLVYLAAGLGRLGVLLAADDGVAVNMAAGTARGASGDAVNGPGPRGWRGW